MNRESGEETFSSPFIPHYFYRFNYLLMKDFRPECLENLKLNKTNGKTLMVLFRKGSRTMSELVQHMNIEKGSMTSVVDHLIQRDLAVRERDQMDRRRVIINLSEDGRTLARELEGEMNNYILFKLNLLGEERKNAVKDFVSIAKESIEIWENQCET
ncbi:MarR family transcriptional regulator [Oceanispirochaeta sp.]|jgi:DNA-binding MarR family transcriptional regulator|uniref:MarR family winged helix-turn-helix transcriptional regulator n=1 Tax=Oceanispirochaeta sp. TaxID=2035350 RepID=UPI00263782B6|nr:MarR family transcriptional regulator [Oceanispirochaeta sp.]MDA3958909.1 MarR family transcriptional regulator [Oceanispirochaeta sp.]